MPNTVNTNRGGAVPTRRYDSKTAYETPLHPKKVHFSSTPLVVNNYDREVLGSQNTDIDQTAASILHNTALTVAKELKHIRQPKLTILKGGCSQSAVLRYKGSIVLTVLTGDRPIYLFQLSCCCDPPLT